MKNVATILAFYLLALSLIPCSDGGMDVMAFANELFGIEHTDESDHDQHSNDCGDDTCSTFCICSCCSLVLNIPTKDLFRLKVPTPAPHTVPAMLIYYVASPSHPPVWQPPRLA